MYCYFSHLYSKQFQVQHSNGHYYTDWSWQNRNEFTAMNNEHLCRSGFCVRARLFRWFCHFVSSSRQPQGIDHWMDLSCVPIVIKISFNTNCTAKFTHPFVDSMNRKYDCRFSVANYVSSKFFPRFKDYYHVHIVWTIWLICWLIYASNKHSKNE